MTLRVLGDAIIGNIAERPPADNARGGVSNQPNLQKFIAEDTGDIYESNGSSGIWTKVGSLGSSNTIADATTTTAGKVKIDHAGGGVALTTDGVALPAGMIGTTSSTACAGNNARLSDTRTPTDGSVTTAKIAALAVTNNEINDVAYSKVTGAPASDQHTTAVDYSALITESWITVTAANKIVTLPDASLVPANHPGFTVKVFGGSNCTVEPPQLAPPVAPVPTSPHTGGTVADGVYTVEVTYVNALGETLGSAQATVTAAGTVADTSTLVIPSPIAETGATGWNAYVSAVGGVTLYLQNVTPTLIGTDLTLTAPPSSITANPPTSSTASVCAIDGVATYMGLVSNKQAATFKSNGVDYLIGL